MGKNKLCVEGKVTSYSRVYGVDRPGKVSVARLLASRQCTAILYLMGWQKRLLFADDWLKYSRLRLFASKAVCYQAPGLDHFEPILAKRDVFA